MEVKTEIKTNGHQGDHNEKFDHTQGRAREGDHNLEHSGTLDVGQGTLKGQISQDSLGLNTSPINKDKKSQLLNIDEIISSPELYDPNPSKASKKAKMPKKPTKKLFLHTLTS